MKILGLTIKPLFYEDFFEKITKLQTQVTVFTPNPEILLETKKDKNYQNILQNATYLTNDGIGLYIGYQIAENQYGKILNFFLLPYYFFNLIFRRSMLYQKYGDRICGSDITKDLIDFAQENAVRVAIIDLYSPTDEKKVSNQQVFGPRLQEVFPKLQFDYHIYNPDDIEDIIEHISSSKAQILFSTLGMKSQEASVNRVMKSCPNIKLGLGIGSSFDYFTGFQRRAPKFMRSLGLEWLYRIFTSPGKIQRLKRITNAVIVFPMVVLFDK